MEVEGGVVPNMSVRRRVAWMAACVVAVTACTSDESGSSGDPAVRGYGVGAAVEAGPGALSNVSIDAGGPDSTVAVGWYAYSDAAATDQVYVSVSDDAGTSFAAPVLVAEGVVQPDVEVVDDGSILVSAVVYDIDDVIDPADGSIASWPVLYRSADGGASFVQIADLRSVVGQRVLTGAMPTGLAASADGQTLVIAFQDSTPLSALPPDAPTWDPATYGRPAWALISRDGGTTWGDPQVIAPSTCLCCELGPFVDGDRVGIALRLVTPVEEGFEERDTAVVLQDETGEFGAPKEIHDDRYVLDLGGCPASGPEVVSAGGRLHAAWWSGAEGRAPGWWYASGSSDGEFGDPCRSRANWTSPTASN
jgi:hypothetical protein